MRGAVEEAKNLHWTPSAIDALRHVLQLDTESKLVRALLLEIERLPWTHTPRLTDNGRSVGLVDLGRCMSLGSFGAGLLLMAPDQRYPEHSHPPAEIYLVLHGTSSWMFGGSTDYVEVEPGGLVMNNPNDMHGVVSGDEPLLALYVLIPE